MYHYFELTCSFNSTATFLALILLLMHQRMQFKMYSGTHKMDFIPIILLYLNLKQAFKLESIHAISMVGRLERYLYIVCTIPYIFVQIKVSKHINCANRVFIMAFFLKNMQKNETKHTTIIRLNCTVLFDIICRR